jgi:nucleoid DNA-binding protein
LARESRGAGRIALGTKESTCHFWGAYKKKVNFPVLYDALTAIQRFSKVDSLLIFLEEELLMTKPELVAAVQKGCDCGCDLSKKAIEGIIDCTLENIAKAVKKDKRFSYPGFGTFTVRKRKPRSLFTLAAIEASG